MRADTYNVNGSLAVRFVSKQRVRAQTAKWPKGLDDVCCPVILWGYCCRYVLLHSGLR